MKRFLIAFALVAATVGVASLMTGGTQTTTDSSADVTAPVVAPSGVAATVLSIELPTTIETTDATGTNDTNSPVGTSAESAAISTVVTLAGPLPAPDLDNYCAQVVGLGAVASEVDGDFAFSCSSSSAPGPTLVSVDVACAAEFGRSSRRVSLMTSLRELRCIPHQRSEIGSPDFDRYCRHVYGPTARSSSVAADDRGWRCVAVLHGVYEELGIDYEHHEVDWVCQVSTGVESFADKVEDLLGGWRCYEGP